MRHSTDLKQVSFPFKSQMTSSLTIFSSPSDVPFLIQRVFVIKAEQACKRGSHAHKECNQLLVCLQGECLVTIDDGQSSRQEICLNKPNEGLFIPATLWAEQIYEDHTILMVFADQAYDEADYIRDYQAFLAWKKESA